MADLDAIFKAYDIRGIVPDQLDPVLAERIGAAFARFALDSPGGASRILVARDMRPSGPELVSAFTEGAQRQGVDVVDLGLASTDLLYFAAPGRLVVQPAPVQHRTVAAPQPGGEHARRARRTRRGTALAHHGGMT